METINPDQAGVGSSATTWALENIGDYFQAQTQEDIISTREATTKRFRSLLGLVAGVRCWWAASGS